MAEISNFASRPRYFSVSLKSPLDDTEIIELPYRSVTQQCDVHIVRIARASISQITAGDSVVVDRTDRFSGSQPQSCRDTSAKELWRRSHSCADDVVCSHLANTTPPL